MLDDDDPQALVFGYITGGILLAILAWHIPFWTADFTGYRAELDAYVASAEHWQEWPLITVHAGLVLAGALIVFIAYMIVFTAGFLIAQIAVETGKWIGKNSARLAGSVAEFLERVWEAFASALHFIFTFIWEILSWPFRIGFEFIADYIAALAQRHEKARAQRLELRAAYDEFHRANFRSFRAFRKYLKALQNHENPPYPGQSDDEGDEDVADPAEEQRAHDEQQARRAAQERARKEREQKERAARERVQREQAEREKQERQRQQRAPYEAALALLNLREPFTEKDMIRNYRAAMMNAHPDRGGDEKAAQRVNMARDLIKKRKGWS